MEKPGAGVVSTIIHHSDFNIAALHFELGQISVYILQAASEAKGYQLSSTLIMIY